MYFHCKLLCQFMPLVEPLASWLVYVTTDEPGCGGLCPKDTRLCRDIYDIPSNLGQPSPDVRNVLTCVTLHHFNTSHNTYIFDSLEAAPPVTLATRSWDSSFFRSSSCLSSSSFFLPRRSLALILAWPPSKEK